MTKFYIFRFFYYYYYFIEIFLNGFDFSDKNDKFSSYQCVMRDVCGVDGDLKQNCPYDGPPIPFPIAYKEKFKELCPQLFTSVLGKKIYIFRIIKILKRLKIANLISFLFKLNIFIIYSHSSLIKIFLFFF